VAGPVPYPDFGAKLAKYRLAAGFEDQADLAEAVASSQQTVSRWEAGLSRPRQGQIAALGAALRISKDQLLGDAGYANPPSGLIVQSRDQPFPLEQVDPLSFERLIRRLLEALYPDAKVHSEGGHGHKQEGIDIEVVRGDERLHFQCKRVRDFGAAKVRKAVEAYDKDAAAQVIIVLSRVASPAARKEIQKYARWDIWDREDISDRIRSLSPDAQVQIVDAFFPGQRLALLGQDKASIWQTIEGYFAPYAAPGPFTHRWPLIGRQQEFDALSAHLGNGDVGLVLLVGAVGSGKSRLLKAALEFFIEERPGLLVRFLTPGGAIGPKDLDNLGGDGKILVVDDAHNAPDLSILFQYAANPANRTRLVLALRQYGLEAVTSAASRFLFIGDRVQTVVLASLSRDDAKRLALEVFEANGGPQEKADYIAARTADCPLATTVGAYILSKAKRRVDFAGEPEFRDAVIGAFIALATGHFSRDERAVKKLLTVAALTQPFLVDEQSFVDLCAKAEDLSPNDVPRLVRLLRDAGVLVERGGQCRIVPDALADFIIERECVGEGRVSTGYAEKLLDAADHRLRGRIVLNLGRLDWRLSDGDTSNSKLLELIWRKLTPTNETDDYDGSLDVVEAVAFFQPRQALELVQSLIRKGWRPAKGSRLLKAPPILKLVAYSSQFRTQACEALWAIGRNDRRELGPHPDHAIRILAELAAIEIGKPREFTDAVVDFALSLTDEANWTGCYTPLSIVSGAVKTEGDKTTVSGPTLAFHPFHVIPAHVRSLRERIRRFVIERLIGDSLAVAVKSAAFLHEMLRHPMGMFGASIPTDVQEAWADEFVDTLNAVKDTVASGGLHPLVFLEIARSVSWHAAYGTRTRQSAQAILELRPNNLEFEALAALVDPFGRAFERPRRSSSVDDWTKAVKAAAEPLCREFPDGEALRAKIDSLLADVARSGIQAEPFGLYRELLRQSPSLAAATIEATLTARGYLTDRFTAEALGVLLTNDPAEALDLSERLLAKNDEALTCAVGQAHGWFDFSRDVDGRHRALVCRVIEAGTPAAVENAVNAIDRIATVDKTSALRLILSIDLARLAATPDRTAQADDAVDRLFNLFHTGHGVGFADLSAEDVDDLLKRLLPVPRLSSYWVQAFLAAASKSHARLCAGFFRARVERAAKLPGYPYTAIADVSFPNVSLEFASSSEFPLAFAETYEWMRNPHVDLIETKQAKFIFQAEAATFFEILCRPIDQVALASFETRLATGDATDVEIIGNTLREVDHDFIFRRQEFVSRFMARAQTFGPDVLERARNNLFGAAISGIKSGVPGQPFPRDVETRDKAEAVLRQISPLSPEFELYEGVKKTAERDIEIDSRRPPGWDDDA
jgi:transcriptional regulator with XRE-family HTH domain